MVASKETDPKHPTTSKAIILAFQLLLEPLGSSGGGANLGEELRAGDIICFEQGWHLSLIHI